MSDEQFLARWSRRKQEAKADHAKPAPENAEPPGSASPDRAAAESVPLETELSKLPPIESIDAATDITAFLRKGIPQELSRAALRRAWSADPAIRDFVGLAENAWDFTDPNAMAGFGGLDYSAEQVDALVRRIVGGVVEAAETVPNAPAETAQDAVRTAPAEAGLAQSSNPVNAFMDPRRFDESAAVELPSNSAASQPAAARDASEAAPLPRRTHGGALPQ
jgi:Protein of unknown function (DUF3306)